VVPTFTIWDAALGKYRLRFDPAVELVRTGDLEADIKANTQKLTSIIEEYVREYPEQWFVGAPAVEDAATGGCSAVLRTASGFGFWASGFRLPRPGLKAAPVLGFELSTCIIWGFAARSRYLFLRETRTKSSTIVSAASQEIKCIR